MATFAAIDFETANNSRDSACSIGIVIVSNGKIVERVHELIRPPNSYFQFTYIHGLTWDDVSDAPSFSELWRDINKHITKVNFLAAHNAPFDRGVLESCCSLNRIAMPSLPFHCTVQIARKYWRIYPTKLPDVCKQLNIGLNHHDALSDAEACANIVIAAQKKGWKP